MPARIEAVRVSALGKKGSVSALLATLGAMAPEERKSAGAAINGLKTEVTGADRSQAPPSLPNRRSMPASPPSAST